MKTPDNDGPWTVARTPERENGPYGLQNSNGWFVAMGMTYKDAKFVERLVALAAAGFVEEANK